VYFDVPFFLSRLVVIGGCAAVSVPLFAAPLIDEVVVSASRVTQPASLVGVSVEVLDAQQLRASGQVTLADSLRSLPGISVSNAGGLGKATSVFIRGEDGFRTRVYWDGIALSDTSATQASPRFDALLTQSLERVEVLKGPQALLYGADAGGVVSLFSREASEPLQGELAVEAGRFDTATWAGHVRGKTARQAFFLGLNGVDTQGFSSLQEDPTADNDGARLQQWHATGRQQLSSTQSLGVVLHGGRTANEYDNCWDNSSFEVLHSCEDRSRHQAARADWRHKGEQLQQEFSLNHYQQQHRRFVAPERAQQEAVEGVSQLAQYFANWRVNPQVGISLGLDAKREGYEQLGSGAAGQGLDESRDTYALYHEWLVSPSEAFSYSVGGRWDSASDYGENASYRLAGAYLSAVGAAQLKWHAALGNGFRLPSFYERYFNARSGYAAPDAQQDFQAENTQGQEAGVDAHWGAVTLKTTLFKNTTEDEIFYDTRNFTGYVQVPGESQAQGVELAGQWQVSAPVRLDAAYTHIKSRQNSSPLAGDGQNQARVQRPRGVYQLGLELSLYEARWRTLVQWRSHYNALAYGGLPMEDFAVWDVKSLWQLTPQVSTHVRISNALDEDYQEVQGYNTAPRAGYLGASWQF
jgi:vitamin B12 transporter